ncbi:MAG: efflux transporter outer membrane subunit [Methylophilaceae bacterium]|nr:efflux transporter outer membrane subunit [Methylophilaceae bacterium]
MNFPHNFSMSLLASLLASACTVGPDYIKPDTTNPATFKEAEGWKIAEPGDSAIPQKWWEVFNDPELNQLEEQVEINNQNLRAVEARFRQSQALVASSRSAYLPLLGINANKTRNQPSGNSTNSINGARIRNTNTLSLNLSWEADIWGRIQRTVESSAAGAEASISDIAAARLSAQAELAQNYFSLRIADSQKKLLDETVLSYQKSMTLTQNRYQAGVVGKSDVVQAETLLKSTQVQAADLAMQRTQFEHAIALLIGKAPAELAIKPTTLNVAIPDIPLSLPSQLLERRPDIAAAERRVASANAQIGVAKAAYFPTLTLSAVAGFQSNNLSDLFNWPSRIWSLGSALALTAFDGGKRHALSDQAVAVYDENVANYRQTVLTGFKEVEDSLIALRVLQEEQKLQAQALEAARASQNYTTNQYKAGIVNYLDVINVYNIALNNERTLINLQGNQMLNSVLLIKALGGGWSVKENVKPLAN